MRTAVRWTLALTALALTIAGYPMTAQGDTVPARVIVRVVDYRAADAAALKTLEGEYSWQTGLWPIVTSGWWSSANTLTTVIDGARALGQPVPVAMIDNTWNRNVNKQGPFFTGNYHDDAGWWALAWLDAYRATGEPLFLHAAEVDDDFMANGWTSSCGGGVTWALPFIHNGDQKGSITNALYVQLSASLFTITGQRSYLDRAESAWQWLSRSGLVRADGMVLDHLENCRPAGPPWSYNQGTVAAALAAMARATGLGPYLTIARRLATASTTSAFLNPGGTLKDVCEDTGTCAADGWTFKGAAVRGWGQLNRALADRPLTAYLDRQADTMIKHDQAVGAFYGQSWAAAPRGLNTSTQASAVDLLNATVEK